MGGKVSNDRTWGAPTKEFCNLGDRVCGAGFDVLARITYGFDGSADRAAAFAIEKLGQE